MKEEPKLTRELPEAVLDPDKEAIDLIDEIQTLKEARAKGDEPGVWMDFDRLIDESPVLRAAIDSMCDYSRRDPESIKAAVIAAAASSDVLRKMKDLLPEMFFSDACGHPSLSWFRAGWEARGAAENEEQLRRMV